MMTKTNPTGDLGSRSNPTNQATLEGGGSNVTVEPQGNPVSITRKNGEMGVKPSLCSIVWGMPKDIRVLPNTVS
jgi:hypothetical protein